jgi:hypothetical protein
MRVLAKGANLMLGHEMPLSARGFSCGAQISENDSDFQGAYFDMLYSPKCLLAWQRKNPLIDKSFLRCIVPKSCS